VRRQRQARRQHSLAPLSPKAIAELDHIASGCSRVHQSLIEARQNICADASNRPRHIQRNAKSQRCPQAEHSNIYLPESFRIAFSLRLLRADFQKALNPADLYDAATV